MASTWTIHHTTLPLLAPPIGFPAKSKTCNLHQQDGGTQRFSLSAKNPFHRSACGDAQRIKHWAQVYIQGSKYQTNTNQFQIPAWKTRGVQPQEKFSTPPKVPHKSNFGTLSRNFSQRLLKPVKFLKPVCLHSNNLVQEQLPLQDEGPQVYCLHWDPKINIYRGYYCYLSLRTCSSHCTTRLGLG